MFIIRAINTSYLEIINNYGKYHEIDTSNKQELTIHEFDPALQPQNAQESFSQKVQHSQKDNGCKHKAWTHSQTNNQTPEKIKEQIIIKTM